MQRFSVGQFAKRTGVNVETIRFYEREGLMPVPRRKESGYRFYLESDIERMLFIGRAKSVGFTLSEIRALLKLRVDTDRTCGEVRSFVQRKLVQIDEKIQLLARFRTALERMAATCTGDGPTSDCPILDELQSEEA